ncbi:hypothetical protein [Cohnella sp. 56]|uniref:hypothetical protein n=1 Tax=Cohnella sp. 56 TaxID=3113722 RepID=UPI0030E9C6DD
MSWLGKLPSGLGRLAQDKRGMDKLGMGKLGMDKLGMDKLGMGKLPRAQAPIQNLQPRRLWMMRRQNE